MSFLSRRSAVSTSQMFRLLSALLICVLMFSHGTMGNAVPHGNAVGHSHIGEHSQNIQSGAEDSDHHSDAVDIDFKTTDGGSQSEESKAAEVAHAHAAADRVPASAPLPDHPVGGVQPPGLLVIPLASAPQAPLLEPPSA